MPPVPPFFKGRILKGCERLPDECPDEDGIFSPIGSFDTRMRIHTGGPHMGYGFTDIIRVEAAGQHDRLGRNINKPATDIPVMGLAGRTARAGCRIVRICYKCIAMRTESGNG